MHARPRQTGGRTDGQTDRQTNIMAIARRFVLTNASRAKNCEFVSQSDGTPTVGNRGIVDDYTSSL